MITHTTPRFLLDRDRENSAAVGYVLVDTEIEFLKVALTGNPIFVRGDTLCRWAEALARGRGIEWCDLVSPTAAIRKCCPGISAEQARELRAALGDRGDAPSPTVRGMLKTLYGDGPWDALPSREHAAQWLLWRAELELPDYAVPLVRHQSASWAAESDPDHLPLYEVDSREGAVRLLEDWLGLSQQSGALDSVLGSFPIEVPEKWILHAREVWSIGIQESCGEAYLRLADRALSPDLATAVAEEALGYFARNAEKLSPSIVQQLDLALPPTQAAKLRRLAPPAEPGDVPSSPEAVLSWFVDRYLPFRQWQVEHGGESAREIAQRTARNFAKWYLSTYPVALQGAAFHDDLSFVLSGTRIRSFPGGVTLWLILDGLPYPDSLYFTRELRRASPRISIENHRPVFSSLPTITAFAKPALLSGAPPVVALKDGSTHLSSNALISRGQHPAEQLRAAAPGDVYIWSLLEPDSTYHGPGDRATLLAAARGQLSRIAEQVAEALLAVPDGMAARCFVTTDHGRLLTASKRLITIPTGMQAHGRAAWGQSGVAFGPDGLHVDEDLGLACLDAQRFHLPEDVAILLGTDSFVTVDGRTGTELFAHGGCFPEEVLVPWIEVARDVAKPTVLCRVSGAGRAGSEGLLTLRISNSSDVRLNVVSLRLLLPGANSVVLPLRGETGARSDLEVVVPLTIWPTKAQIASASAVLTLQQGNGAKWEYQAVLGLESEEMYARDNILDDLLGDL